MAYALFEVIKLKRLDVLALDLTVTLSKSEYYEYNTLNGSFPHYAVKL